MSLPRADSWNAAMAASPGELDLTVAAANIDGEVPPILHGGRVLSNGPGWTRIGDQTAHPFDGHGYVRSFELLPDGACRLRARFVQTPSYVAEKQAGKIVHRGLATNASPHFWENIRPGPPRNVANTTIVRWGDRLLAGWEAGAPYALDPETLETHGEEHFGGVIAGAATLAHMHRDHQQDRLTICSVAMGRQTTFTFRELDREDQVVSTSVAEIDGMVFTHDYALTPSWFVLGGNPLRLNPVALAKTLLGAGTMLHAVAPDARRGGSLHLVPRGGSGPVRTITLPEPAFVVHFGNAFERDGALIVDVCALDAFKFGEEFGYSGPDRPFDLAKPEARGPQRLFRITIPDGSDTATWERLTPHGVDFPRFHPNHEGRETPLLFGATRKDTRYSDPFDSIIGIDLRDRDRPAQLWTAPEAVFVGEPLFVPDAEHADQGHIVAILSDGLAAQTTLAIFDAAALARGPVASIPLPLLPIAFHGEWDGTP
ncbi:MAG: all-trans-8'-apo-beta-carotenal 15,15'-oxygenase [Myxococcota bacterium]|jgi:all-trans-8'-apo-beta-carotenal 15,15'-oxygenase